MHYKNTLLVACVSLALLASASPQNAAATGAVSKSTKAQTVVATATIGGADPAATAVATGTMENSGTGGSTGVDNGSDGDANDDNGTAAGSSTGTSANNGGMTSDGSSGSVNAAVAAKNAVASGKSGSGVGTGTGSGTRTSAGIDSGYGAEMSAVPNDKNGPPAGFWEKFGGVADGDRAHSWSKFSAGNGHPHQPVARGWSKWFGGGANKGQGSGLGSGDKQHHPRALLARDAVIMGGPSWNDVRSSEVEIVGLVARGIAKDGQGWAGHFEGGMGYAGKRQGSPRQAGYGY